MHEVLAQSVCHFWRACGAGPQFGHNFRDRQQVQALGQIPKRLQYDLAIRILQLGPPDLSKHRNFDFGEGSGMRCWPEVCATKCVPLFACMRCWPAVRARFRRQAKMQTSKKFPQTFAI